MRRAAVLLAFMLSLWAVSQSSAQNLTLIVPTTPSIQLSSQETTRAKEVMQDLKSAKDRSDIALERWKQFLKDFQLAHPELKGTSPTFSLDFSAAYVIFGELPLVPPRTVTAIEVSAKERQTAQTRYEELKASDESVRQAQQNWDNFEKQLLSEHVGTVEPAGPWRNGIALTSDFRTAVPRSL